MRTAVLGLGNMGHSIATRLVGAGHDVTVWNRTPGRAAELVARGATEASSPASAAADADAVLLSVRDDDAARSVVQALAAAGFDGPVVNCTTSAPAATAELAALVPGYVAAPILGAPKAVAGGTATYVVAGPERAVGGLDELWPALTDRVLRCGDDPARASVVKVVTNHLLLTGLVALTEAVAVAQAAGLEDGFVTEFLSASAMLAPGLRNRLDDVVSGDHDGWFATPLGAKDLGLFTALGAANTVDTPLAALARDRYLAAAEAGFGEADVAAVVELLRD